jgi:hypothetical protein
MGPYCRSRLRLTDNDAVVIKFAQISQKRSRSGTLLADWKIFANQVSPGGLMNFLQKHTVDRLT